MKNFNFSPSRLRGLFNYNIRKGKFPVTGNELKPGCQGLHFVSQPVLQIDTIPTLHQNNKNKKKSTKKNSKQTPNLNISFWPWICRIRARILAASRFPPVRERPQPARRSLPERTKRISRGDGRDLSGRGANLAGLRRAMPRAATRTGGQRGAAAGRPGTAAGCPGRAARHLPGSRGRWDGGQVAVTGGRGRVRAARPGNTHLCAWPGHGAPTRAPRGAGLDRPSGSGLPGQGKGHAPVPGRRLCPGLRLNRGGRQARGKFYKVAECFRFSQTERAGAEGPSSSRDSPGCAPRGVREVLD